MVSPTLTLEDIVSKTADLPSLPAATLAVMKETDSPTGTAQSVARYLSQDQGLTARVLRLSNSAYYGLARQVSDVSEAVVVLGMRCIRNLALVAGTYPWMSKPVPGYMLGPKEMWNHACGVAVAAKLIARESGKAHPDEAFTAGLLHNLGKIALSIWLENKLVAMMQYAQREGLAFDEVERKLLGYDHCQVGAYLAERWNLPPQLVATMRWHHHPNGAEERLALTDCVHVGDYLAMCFGLGLGGDGMRYEFEEDSLTRLGLTFDDLDRMVDAFSDDFEQHQKLFEELQK